MSGRYRFHNILIAVLAVPTTAHAADLWDTWNAAMDGIANLSVFNIILILAVAVIIWLAVTGRLFSGTEREGGLFKRIKEKFILWRRAPKSRQDMEDQILSGKLPHTKPYGESRFARPEDIKDYGNADTGVYLGLHRSQGWEWSTGDDKIRKSFKPDIWDPVYTLPKHHLLCAVMTRGGKGQGIIAPTLAHYRDSVICIDPKGENAALTWKRRQELGQDVYVLNPWSLHHPDYIPLPSSGINPLDMIQPGDPFAVTNAELLADMLMMPDPTSKDSFFDKTARSVIVGLMLYLAAHKPTTKTVRTLRQYCALTIDELQTLAEDMIESDAFDGALALKGKAIQGLQGKTADSIKSTIDTHTEFLDNAVVSNSLSVADIDFTELKRKPMTVYVIIPDDLIETQARWLRLIIGQAIIAVQRTQAFDHRVLFLLDEFPALGRLDIKPGRIAGYGGDLALFCQDLKQLEHIYGTGTHDIISNCAYQYYGRLNNMPTCDYVSKLLGNMTINVNTQGGTDGPKQLTGRALYTPDELRTSGADIGFVFAEGTHPIMVKPTLAYQTPEIQQYLGPHPLEHAARDAVVKQPSEPEGETEVSTPAPEERMPDRPGPQDQPAFRTLYRDGGAPEPDPVEDFAERLKTAATDHSPEEVNILLNGLDDEDAAFWEREALYIAAIKGNEAVVRDLLFDAQIPPSGPLGQRYLWVMEQANAVIASLYSEWAHSNVRPAYADWHSSADGQKFTLADLHKPDAMNDTGLHNAAKGGSFSRIVSRLIANGEISQLMIDDLTREDDDGITPIGYLAVFGETAQAFNPTVWAGRPDDMKTLWDMLPEIVRHKSGIDIYAQMAEANKRRNIHLVEIKKAEDGHGGGG